MPNIDNTTEHDSEINVDMEQSKNEEAQRFFTEVTGLDLIFYQALCGWQSKAQVNEKSELGMPILEYSRTFAINKNMRYCNEAYASSLAHSTYGLINHLVATSNLTEKEIYDLWDTYVDSINYDMITDFYGADNYGIKIESADRITMFICMFSTYTKKARSGTTLDAFTKTIMSIFQHRIGVGLPPSEKSVKDKILGR